MIPLSYLISYFYGQFFGLLLVDVEEGRPRDVQFISDAAQRPDINFEVISRLSKYFKGWVVEGADVLQSALEASTAEIP